MNTKTAILTGVNGQDGAYLSKLLLSKGYRVIGVIRRKQANLEKLRYLKVLDKITIEIVNLLHKKEIDVLLEKYKPQEFYNLAAQSSVYESFISPKATFEFNTLSVFNILDAVKQFDKNIRIYQASSSEMFGKVNALPITENSILHPVSPYAISKASAHYTCVFFRESYQMHVSSGILFNHESYLRNTTFFVKKVITSCIKISKAELDILEVGNISIKRDFGFAPKYVEAMHLMLQKSTPSDYLICSGKSVSLKEIIDYVFDKLGVDKAKYKSNSELFRPSEIIDIYGDNSKAKNTLNWDYDYSFFDVLDMLINEELENY
jgi:GDPmannose 4,6-dehydratase